MPLDIPPPVKYQKHTPLKLTLPKAAVYPFETPSSTTSNMQGSVINNNSDEQWLAPINPKTPMPDDAGILQETVAIHRGGTVLKFKFG